MHNHNIHTKTEIRDDLKSARWIMRRIEQAITANKWETVADECNELSGLFSALRSLAIDNHEGIEDFNYLYPDQIEAIRAAKAVA